MRAALVTNELEPTYYRAALVEELERRRHDVRLVRTPTEAAADHDFDVAVMRLCRFYSQPGELRVAQEAALILEAHGVRFLNSAAARAIAQQKHVCHQLFAAAGLPQPETLLVDDLPDPLPWPEAVVKPVGGSRGIGVEKVDSFAAAQAHAKSLNELCVAQPFIRATGIRVVCSQDQVAFVVEKHASEKHWMATFAAGARRVDPSTFDPEVAALAVGMTRAVGLDMAGCDLLRDEDCRLYALEINSDFGLVQDVDQKRGTPSDVRPSRAPRRLTADAVALQPQPLHPRC